MGGFWNVGLSEEPIAGAPPLDEQFLHGHWKLGLVPELLIINESGFELVIERNQNGKWEFIKDADGKPYVKVPVWGLEKMEILAEDWNGRASAIDKFIWTETNGDTASRMLRTLAGELLTLLKQLGTNNDHIDDIVRQE